MARIAFCQENYEERQKIDPSNIRVISIELWGSPPERTTFIGILKNIGKFPIEKIKISLTLYDEEENIVDRRYEMIPSNLLVLYPNDRLPFKVDYEWSAPPFKSYKFEIKEVYSLDRKDEKYTRRWKPGDLELLWFHVEKGQAFGFKYYEIKGEIMNNGTAVVDDLYLRIYGFDESGKLAEVEVTAGGTPFQPVIGTIKPKDSAIFGAIIKEPITEIKSWKIETN